MVYRYPVHGSIAPEFVWKYASGTRGISARIDPFAISRILIVPSTDVKPV